MHAEIGKARPCNETYVTRTNHTDIHVLEAPYFVFLLYCAKRHGQKEAPVAHHATGTRPWRLPYAERNQKPGTAGPLLMKKKKIKEKDQGRLKALERTC